MQKIDHPQEKSSKLQIGDKVCLANEEGKHFIKQEVEELRKRLNKTLEFLEELENMGRRQNSDDLVQNSLQTNIQSRDETLKIITQLQDLLEGKIHIITNLKTILATYTQNFSSSVNAVLKPLDQEEDCVMSLPLSWLEKVELSE